jgi:hypothetical protein
VKNFAREEFGLKHRYTTVLHTDEPHPHVHMVVKAVSEQGVRLNIRKAALREWRRDFARHLRALGVAANATERAVRGETRASKRDGVYRARLRGDSTYVRAVAAELLEGNVRTDPGKHKLVETRKAVEGGWRSVASLLEQNGHQGLARDVQLFVHRLPPALTEKEQISAQLLERTRMLRTRDRHPTR